MKRRRVKITGIGPVTPAGIGREEFWNGILEPVSRIRPFTQLGDEFGDFVAGAITDFDATEFIERARIPKGASRQTLFAVVGAALALRDAGMPLDSLATQPVAVVTGSSLMDLAAVVASVDSVRKSGPRYAHARSVYTGGVGSVASAINQAFGIAAPTVAFSNQCNSGINAIGYAAGLVASGEIDVALCGGTEAPLHRSPLLELKAAGIIAESVEMAERQARPFDLWRTTGVIGEGAAMFVLEPEDSPRPGYSYICGYGFATDAPTHVCSGLLESARMAVGHSRLRPEDIDVLSAWGPGDRHVDRGEAEAMVSFFGRRLSEVAASSIKGSVGSALGAAPAIQLAAAALGQRAGLVTPTVNWEYPDPDCPLRLSKLPMAVDHRYTLVNTHGLGATNAAVVLERC